MKQANRFMSDMLDFDGRDTVNDSLWQACAPVDAEASRGVITLHVPFQAYKRNPQSFEPNPASAMEVQPVVVRAYGSDVIRVTSAFGGDIPGDDSVMFEWDKSLRPSALTVRATKHGWAIETRGGVSRMTIGEAPPRQCGWGQHKPATPQNVMQATVCPDGATPVPFMSHDAFGDTCRESVALGAVLRNGDPHRSVFSLRADADECFAGTGERFAKMDLAGRTLTLENVDALGVNNRRAYKNMPFYVSSRPYGLMIHTSAHVRMSLADISTRAAQAMVESPVLDLFFIGGGSVERVLWNFRRICGFPRNVPVWSFGTWMSRMTYFSEKEVRRVASKLRSGQFPCDVIHIDTGWFAKDWVCEWEFSKERFPDPRNFMRDMNADGFRISLWQNPNIGVGNKLLAMACKKRYVAPRKDATASGSDFSNIPTGGVIDFSNPEAVKWYQGMLARLLKLGASAIKTDFGEEIDPNADYCGMPASLLHNLYALLYQKAAFEITEETTGEGIIWARSSWLGCQRYPLHWGGDSACTWDGLAGDIRGGLHFGLSGFAFWSHDIPGFHGIPTFMDSWPANDLYVRWTQAGVFTSHMRYHGAQPREPYEYPEVADIVRKWLRLRYALIPYLIEQSAKAIRTGLPILRAMVFHHEKDPTCWHIDDQYYFGDRLLVAPVLNSEGRRNVYLPEGAWRNLWTGERHVGPVLLKDVVSPLAQIPVFVVDGATIPVYPERVLCTDEMDFARIVPLKFDATFRGLSRSCLGKLTGL